MKSVPSPTEKPEVKTAPPPASPSRGAKLYDGKTFYWWKSRYTDLKERLTTYQAELTTLKEEQNAARRKRIIHQSGVNRRALVAKGNEVTAKQAQIDEVQNSLAQFTESAYNAGLSVEMLEGDGR